MAKKKSEKVETPRVPVYFETKTGRKVFVCNASIQDGKVGLDLFDREEVEKNNESN